jgi:hypothetical protein
MDELKTFKVQTNGCEPIIIKKDIDRKKRCHVGKRGSRITAWEQARIFAFQPSGIVTLREASSHESISVLK